MAERSTRMNETQHAARDDDSRCHQLCSQKASTASAPADLLLYSPAEKSGYFTYTMHETSHEHLHQDESMISKSDTSSNRSSIDGVGLYCAREEYSAAHRSAQYEAVRRLALKRRHMEHQHRVRQSSNGSVSVLHSLSGLQGKYSISFDLGVTRVRPSVSTEVREPEECSHRDSRQSNGEIPSIGKCHRLQTRLATPRYLLALFVAKFFFSGLNNVDYVSFALHANKQLGIEQYRIGIALTMFNLSAAVVAVALLVGKPFSKVQCDSLIHHRLSISLISYSILTTLTGLVADIERPGLFYAAYTLLVCLKGMFYAEGFAVISLCGAIVFDDCIKKFKAIDVSALLLGDLIIASIVTYMHSIWGLKWNAVSMGCTSLLCAVVIVLILPRKISGSSHLQEDENEGKVAVRRCFSKSQVLANLEQYRFLMLPVFYTFSSSLLFISCSSATVNLVDQVSPGENDGELYLLVFYIIYNVVASPLSLLLGQVPKSLVRPTIMASLLLMIPFSLLAQPWPLYWLLLLDETHSVYLLIASCVCLISASIPGFTLNLEDINQRLDAQQEDEARSGKSEKLSSRERSELNQQLRENASLACTTAELLGRVVGPIWFMGLLNLFRQNYGLAFVTTSLVSLPAVLLHTCTHNSQIIH